MPLKDKPEASARPAARPSWKPLPRASPTAQSPLPTSQPLPRHAWPGRDEGPRHGCNGGPPFPRCSLEGQRVPATAWASLHTLNCWGAGVGGEQGLARARKEGNATLPHRPSGKKAPSWPPLQPWPKGQDDIPPRLGGKTEAFPAPLALSPALTPQCCEGPLGSWAHMAPEWPLRVPLPNKEAQGLAFLPGGRQPGRGSPYAAAAVSSAGPGHRSPATPSENQVRFARTKLGCSQLPRGRGEQGSREPPVWHRPRRVPLTRD